MWEGLYAPTCSAAAIPSGHKAPPTLTPYLYFPGAGVSCLANSAGSPVGIRHAKFSQT